MALYLSALRVARLRYVFLVFSRQESPLTSDTTSGGFHFFRKDAQKGDYAKLSQVKGEIEVLPKKISRFFSEGLPKPKFCEAIIYERENARANGPDL